jgi:hypothetical protein
MQEMMNPELNVVFMPKGSFQLEWADMQDAINKSSRLLQEEIYKQFSADADSWILFLGFCDHQVSLSPSLDYWRNFSGVFARRLCQTPDIAPHKCCIGRGIAALKPKCVNDKFLYQAMLSHAKTLLKMAQGNRFQNINSKQLSDLILSLPPLLEQKKIAEILKTVDDAIEKTAQPIEKTKEIKRSLMQSMKKRQNKIVELMSLMGDLIAMELDHEKYLEMLKKGLAQVLLTGKTRVGV